jgi:hypothetical protein
MNHTLKPVGIDSHLSPIMLKAMLQIKQVISIHHLKKIGSSAVLVAAIVWGLRVIVIEGFVLASPRNWAGDFTSAFYDEIYWKDDGYMYGPVFTIVKSISNQFPDLFRVEMFAASNVLVFIATLLILWKVFDVQRLNIVEKLSILALVSTFSHLYYAFSVSAFPEFLELMLIALTFYLIKKGRLKSSMVILGVAAMVKIVPIILLPFLFPLVGLSGVIAFLVTIFLFLTTMVIYLDINYFQAFYKVFEITVRGSGNIFHPESTEHYGLSSALGRLEISSLTTNAVIFAAIIMIGVTYTLALSSFILFSRKFSKEKSLEFLLVLTSALIPFVSSSTHRHSFIFLIPLAFFIVKVKNVWALFIFTASFLSISIPIYAIFQLDFRIISYLYLEPVIMNFVVLLLLISVGIMKKKENSLNE